MMSPVGGQQREADISHDISWPAVDIVCDICVICATFCLMEMAKVVRERVTKVEDETEKIVLVKIVS